MYRDGFEDSMFKAKASSLQGQGQYLRGQSQGHWSWLLKKNKKNDISHQNTIVKLTTKRLSKHKLSTKLSLSLHHTAYKLSTLITDRWPEADASRPRPRPDHLEGKAKARTVRGQSQGHDFGSSSCPWAQRQSSRTPSLITGYCCSLL